MSEIEYLARKHLQKNDKAVVVHYISFLIYQLDFYSQTHDDDDDG